jgi:hypothetical protein
MDRRKSIKALLITGASAGVLVEACKHADKKITDASSASANPFLGPDRMPAEIKHYEKVAAEKFFEDHEMKTIRVLSDIIIPKDEVSGSATAAKVPEFIAFIVNDMPEHQLPLRGGMRWLDMQCLNKYNHAFVDCTPQQQIEMVDAIAYPNKAKPEMSQGVAFFNIMRDLVVTGFYTSEMGVKDIVYMGNVPNQWNGVPDEVLKQYGLAYAEKELKECAHYDKA